MLRKCAVSCNKRSNWCTQRQQWSTSTSPSLQARGESEHHALQSCSSLGHVESVHPSLSRQYTVYPSLGRQSTMEPVHPHLLAPLPPVLEACPRPQDPQCPPCPKTLKVLCSSMVQQQFDQNLCSIHLNVFVVFFRDYRGICIGSGTSPRVHGKGRLETIL